MVSEQVNLIHETHPFGKILKNAKSLHPTDDASCEQCGGSKIFGLGLEHFSNLDSEPVTVIFHQSNLKSMNTLFTQLRKNVMRKKTICQLGSGFCLKQTKNLKTLEINSS